MKKHVKKLIAGFAALTMVVGSIDSTALVVWAKTKESKSDKKSVKEVTLSSTAKENLAAARIMAEINSYGKEDTVKKDSKVKKAVKKAIFNGYNDSTDLSKYNITSEKMDTTTEEILQESGLADTVSVAYDTDSDGEVTTATVEMDAMVTLAADELKENATIYNLTEAQTQELLGMYAQYIQLCEDNADMFGVQVPYNTTKDTNANPIGSMLDIASISVDAVNAGYVGYDTLSGLIQLYMMATQFSITEYKDDVIAARNEALSVIEDGMTTVQKYIALNGWMADNCNFAMDSIMDEMVAPVPEEDPLYTYAYNCMYNMIHDQVYQKTYDYLKDAYGEEQAKAIATQQADSFMVDVQEDKGSGAQQAASTAGLIVGLWQSNQVGTLVGKKAVCFGYASVFNYLVQCANPQVYLKDPNASDLYASDNWKSYEELNFVQNDNGEPVKDEDGNYQWSEEGTAAITDLVKIKFDTDVSMFGQEEEKFDSPHYWNAVKVEGKWYYIDPCYVDIYVECMNRDRVETDGNLNHLYFMFSDTSAREMYKGNYEKIFTLYEGIATDQTYEDAWFAFAKSHIYKVGDKFYYLYDSTDMLDIMSQYGNGSSSSSNTRAANDYEGLFTDTEYKIVYHAKADGDTSDTFVSLVDFNNGQIYNPTTDKMEDNAMIAELYAEHSAYVEEYPSIAISTAYYNGKIYFTLSNVMLSYDLETGAVEKLVEYTEVSGARDMSQGLGGLGFSMTESGSADITVENPPVADMTIKGDKMYVSIATNYGFISGKEFGQLTDYSSYGYQFAETGYNPSYNTYYNNDETNDNDEFMWSANIVGTIDMAHLTGDSHNYQKVEVPESCTEDAYTVERCKTCGKIKPETNEGGKAQTLNEGEEGGKEETAAATLQINITAGEDSQSVRSTTLTSTDTGKKGDPYTFTASAIQEAAEAAELTAGYALVADQYEDETVNYGETGKVELKAEKTTDFAKLELVITDGDQEGAQEIASKLLSSDKEGQKGESYTFAKDIIEKEAADLVPEGYKLQNYEFADAQVAYGETEKMALAADKEAATLTATLKIVVKDRADENAEIIGTDTLTADGKEGETHTFKAEDIKEKAEAIELTGNYKLSEEYAYEDTSVAYGSEFELVLVAEKTTAFATLNIEVKDGETLLATDVLNSEAEGTKGDPHTFKAEDIKAKAEAIELKDNYVLSEYDFKDMEVAYGSSETLTLNAEKAVADAVLEIKVYDSATVDQDDTEKKLVAEKTLKKSGEKGSEVKVTAEDIKKEVGEIEGYKLDESSLPTEDVVIECGGETKTVELTATLIPAGKGHTYVKFTENCYKKTDGHWNSVTNYVCIDCGHAFEESEYDDNFRKDVDKLYDGDASEKTAVWTWSTDGTAAALYQVSTALKDHKFDCIWENSDFSSRTAAEVVRKNTCTDGSLVYTATADGKKDTKTITVESKKHTYNKAAVKDEATGEIKENGAVTWNWAENCSKATVTLVCDVCGDTKEVTVSKGDDAMKVEQTAATCTTAGSDKYTATVTVDGVNFISTRTIESDPATGHNYGEPKWDWTQEENGSYSAAKATFTCKNDESHTKTLDATITKEIDRKANKTIYTATVTLDDKDYKDTKETEISEQDLNPFVDVNQEDYYYDAVLWAVNNNITTGYDDTHFAPLENCNRAQVVTFLWRTMGKPEVKTTKNPFVDINEDDYFYQAVLWAYENKITTGKDKTHFAPNEYVTRSDFVTFMYRQKGEPDVNGIKNPFEDLKEDQYYTNAVLWAYENGITSGKDKTHFAPFDICIRGDVVTFLYRGYGQK